MNTNEPPQNIWKRSRRGPRALLIWGAILAFAAFAIVFCIGVIARMGLSDTLKVAAIFAAVAFTCALVASILEGMCTGRNARRVLIGFVCVVTFVALLYAEEDLRGKWAWESFKHKWEAKGQSFDRQSVIPPTVPDDQNFALTPIIASTYAAMLDKTGHEIKPHDTNVVNRLQALPVDLNVEKAPTNGVWTKAQMTDLAGWQSYYRRLAAVTNYFPVPAQPQAPAQDVLFALSRYDSTIEDLRQASRLPESRFPIEYDKENPAAILLPHLAGVKDCARMLQLRAIAELQAGEPDKAMADVKLMLRLADSLRTEPILISHLVRIAIFQIALQPIWEGVVQHRWSDAQLAELDAQIAKEDFLANYDFAMRGEVVLFQAGIFDYVRRHPERLFGLSNDGFNEHPALVATLAAGLVPKAWFYQNQLRCARMMLEKVIPAANLEQRTISPSEVRLANSAVEAETQRWSPYTIMEKMLLPALANACRRFAYAQASSDLARTAIALERYRSAHGNYPGTLDVLAPEFMAKLPHDVIDGKPFHYQRTEDGKFVLYSIGWNETDDQGSVVLGSGSTPNVDITKGDWVWKFPENKPK